MKEPKDLGVKIGTPKESKWTEILKAQKEALMTSEMDQMISEKVISLAEEQIEIEKAKMKK